MEDRLKLIGINKKKVSEKRKKNKTKANARKNKQATNERQQRQDEAMLLIEAITKFIKYSKKRSG